MRSSWSPFLALFLVFPVACKEAVPSEDDELGEEEESDSSNPDTTPDTGEPLPDLFVPSDDTGIEPSCDPFAQDCLEGEKCVPFISGSDTWDANKCVPINGDKVAGDTCVYDGGALGSDDCGADTLCWDVKEVDGVLQGVCTPFCEGTADGPICEPDTSCLIANDGAINMCVRTCDPLLQDCDEGLGCYWSGGDFQCIFATQDIPSGEPCGYINDCVFGNICLGAASVPSCSGASCCAPYCELSEGSCMLEGTECTTFFEEGLAPPGYEDVGVCVIPG